MSQWVRIFLKGRQSGFHTGGRLSSTDDWAVGDLAECIHDGSWYSVGGIPLHGPQLGDTLVVRKVNGNPKYGPSLGLNRWTEHHYIHYCFRKITPKADAIERSDSSFIDLVRRRSKPAAKPRELKPAQREDA